ncbi:hypothetical protein SAMN05216184_11918 [Georgenia satyanarayanai]|uniref:CopC domain-containing protein n=1 Tax=Georgenia satyanarayanai TaxID=860221 RepID=A0A2Y9AR04_9MICO|nr:copper resistance CopC family protein [Georgenia satyanarayanai]PYF96358.1 hypothetical protein A8987_11918 [Georgenia satyanarayanai]SSA46890.1 hypothetical protein SAMN05216184_11918 [Georgenia satyanarayanai]
MVNSHRSLRPRLFTLAILQALALVVLGGLTVTLATSAAAHDTIIDAEPAQDAVLDTAPSQIVLTYSAEVLDLPSAIMVTDANGEVVAEGEPTIQGQSVVLDLPSALENGAYEVLWSVISSDGHRTEDTYNFTVAASEAAGDAQTTAPAEPTSEPPSTEPTTEASTPAPAASPDADAVDADAPGGGLPIGIVLVPIAVLVLAVIAALVYRRRRQG